MPRLNTTDPNDPNNPGPLDFCSYCWWELDYDYEFETDHPNYEDGNYTCAHCDKPLTWQDD